MNGVRRFLGGGLALSTPEISPDPPSLPPISPGKPSWPPPSPTTTSGPISPSETSKPTQALFLRKDRQKAQLTSLPNDPTSSNQSFHSANTSLTSPTWSQSSFIASSPARPPIATVSTNLPAAGPSSARVPPPSRLARNPINQADRRRNSVNISTKDELLMSLLASEAVVDSREFSILTSEDVEDLKKEHQVLSSRQEAMTKKLSLETKIRDAALSLTKVNASHKKVSKKSEEQLEAANRRVETAQKELWRVSERLNEVHKRLMEHRAGILSFSVRSMEKKLKPSENGIETPESGYDTPNQSSELMSPTLSSMTSISNSSKSRFDGAHLFAGHADTVIPTIRKPPGMGDITSLEEKLKAATDAMNAASLKQTQMARELSALQRDRQLLELEKQEVETSMAMDLQSAEETISALKKKLPRLEVLETQTRELLQEKSVWEQDRAELARRRKEVDDLRRRLEDVETQKGNAAGAEALLAEAEENSRRELERRDTEIHELQNLRAADRAAWERDRATLEDEKMEDLTRLQEEMDKLRGDDTRALQSATIELDEGLATLRTLVQTHRIVLLNRDSSLNGLLSSVGTHLEGTSSTIKGHAKAQEEWVDLRRKLEDDIRSGLDKRESLIQEIEEARRDREEARKEARSLEARLKDQSENTARAPISPIRETSGELSRILAILQPIWSILPSPETRAAKFNSHRQFRAGSPPNAPASPKPGSSSLSDMDVRSLKVLYDNRPTVPGSPNPIAFSIDAFAARVQALIADDRALIERLIRFAQAHDLLKKNAERAQKLAQESNSALETYQKQVRTLEERNMSLASNQAAFQDQVQQLQDVVDRITTEKLELEMQAAAQAETCRQLAEANDTLSARTLTLAEEAAEAPERIRKQLEAQLAECKTALELAQDEVDAMRMSEQSQRIALLDELNSMQTENGTLRAQLRALKK